YFNRNTSRILRMDSRSTKTSLIRKRGHDEQNYPTSLLPQGWPHGRGISGRMPVERVAECSWNRWPDHRGISDRMRPEYALRFAAMVTSFENIIVRQPNDCKRCPAVIAIEL
ncbi:MAG: hypothetical protein ACYCS8_18510, partial [Acidithiobacillus sp.]